MGDSTSCNDFIESYLSYIGDTECPITFHRWCCISMLGAYLGRQIHYKFGHSDLHTNSYVMLMGEPGSRKSTAVKIAKKVITLAGYDKISADKSSKEKFMLDLAGEGEDTNVEDILERNLFGPGESGEYKEMYIACDEFNDFIGNGNTEFVSLLGNMWDYEGTFVNRIKTGKSVTVPNPTISILGGNTQVNFARAFPADTLGQGFFSRLLLVYSDPTGIKIAEPVPPSVQDTAEIAKHLQAIKMNMAGEIKRTEVARKLIKHIYEDVNFDILDGRFNSYNNRRFTHLLKLSLVMAASRMSNIIDEADVIRANTILSHAEYSMPKALGEFGKSRNSDVVNKVMGLLETTPKVLTVKEIYMHVCTDIEKVQDLVELLRGLITADKIFNAGGGYIAKKKLRAKDMPGVIDFDLLTKQERDMII